jgi:hypothetical protein
VGAQTTTTAVFQAMTYGSVMAVDISNGSVIWSGAITNGEMLM